MTFTPEVVDFAESAGPAALVGDIKAPTLIIQGTVDNLFPLSEAIENYRALRASGTTVQMTWYCGGHGVCLTNKGDASVPLQQTRAWLDKYLKGDGAADTGAGFTWVDQRGIWRRADSFPVATDRLTARGKGALRLVQKGGSGPYSAELPSSVSPLTALLLRSAIPSPAKRAVDVAVRAPKPAVVVGAPRLRLTYKGTAPRKKIRVLAQLVDNRTKTVLGNAITPVPLVLDGKTRRLSVPLEPVSASLRKGQRLTLQIVGQSSIYDVFPKGSVRFSRVAVSLPTL
jgi:ABC-2 type transport system ATP-binding protein